MIALEHVGARARSQVFRIAFSECESRILLPYPQQSGLRFFDCERNPIESWRTQIIASSPLDDFVLDTGARIAFDLIAPVNASSEDSQSWVANIPTGLVSVQYIYDVDNGREWYDFLAKRSRFAALTPPWNGLIESNTIQIDNQIIGEGG